MFSSELTRQLAFSSRVGQDISRLSSIHLNIHGAPTLSRSMEIHLCFDQ